MSNWFWHLPCVIGSVIGLCDWFVYCALWDCSDIASCVIASSILQYDLFYHWAMWLVHILCIVGLVLTLHHMWLLLAFCSMTGSTIALCDWFVHCALCDWFWHCAMCHWIWYHCQNMYVQLEVSFVKAVKLLSIQQLTILQLVWNVKRCNEAIMSHQ